MSAVLHPRQAAFPELRLYMAAKQEVEVLNSPSLERGGADAGPQARPPRLGQHGGPSNPLTGLPAHRHVLGGPRDVR